MEELETRLRRVAEARRESEERGAQSRYQDDSRERLRRILKKKNTTAFIGAIAAFEKHFGHLWGHGKRPQERTAEERAWFELWELCRTEALNNGNNQVRAVENELAQYTVRWERYAMNLPAGRGTPGVSSLSETPHGNNEEG